MANIFIEFKRGTLWLCFLWKKKLIWKSTLENIWVLRKKCTKLQKIKKLQNLSILTAIFKDFQLQIEKLNNYH